MRTGSSVLYIVAHELSTQEEGITKPAGRRSFDGLESEAQRRAELLPGSEEPPASGRSSHVTTFADLLQLVRSFPEVETVECVRFADAVANAKAVRGSEEQVGHDDKGNMVLAEEVAGRLRAACKTQLGIDVSVGVGRTRLQAQLAAYALSAAAGGVAVLDDPAEFAQLLAVTPALDLPGVGARIGGMMAALGVCHLTQLQDLRRPELLRRGLPQSAAAEVLAALQQRDGPGDAGPRVRTVVAHVRGACRPC